MTKLDFTLADKLCVVAMQNFTQRDTKFSSLWDGTLCPKAWPGTAELKLNLHFSSTGSAFPVNLQELNVELALIYHKSNTPDCFRLLTEILSLTNSQAVRLPPTRAQ